MKANKLIKLLLIFFSWIFFICSCWSHEEKPIDIYLGIFNDNIKSDFSGLKKLDSAELVKSFLKSINKAKAIKKADFMLWSEGWLIVVRSQDGVKFYRMFDSTIPSNVIFPCDFTLSKKGIYSLESFPHGFSGLRLDIDPKKLLLHCKIPDQ